MTKVTKYVCNKCKEETTEYDTTQVVLSPTVMYPYYGDRIMLNPQEPKGYHLCGECLKEVKEYLGYDI